MAINIKSTINLKRQLRAANTKSSIEIKKGVVGEILKNYNAGLSPVRGFGKFVQYAFSTAKQKGRRSPVTIKQSGELHSSLTAVQKRSKGNNVIVLFFRGARNNKIAKFISFGTDFMDARPLLPGKGQTFKKRITDSFNRIINRNIKKFTK